ncbi:hypothetical protein GGX14DRAFT_578787 [Mycena pura]|uniref:Asparagine synthetase domain-containing protein n=1 Tax=Mycena pura TaxID=153505 RepID=A0AAD6UTC0_9AGAR|nr:hypothetical protein GGX14DRAFT_578787 [Mycena pura]
MLASEMKAFKGLGWQAEWDIESIVHNGEYGDERTVFRGVQKVCGACLSPSADTRARSCLRATSPLCRASGQIQTQAYWDLAYPPVASPPTASLDAMIQTVRPLLVEAVRLRLRADVPLVVYLSGGINSSSIAGIATHLLREQDPNAKLTTFTLAYIVAAGGAHGGASLRKVDATEALLVRALEEAVWHSEQPHATFHGAGKLLLSRAVRDAGFKVVLSGEGSDEIFAGYPWFPLDYLQSADPAAMALGIPLPSADERTEYTRRW